MAKRNYSYSDFNTPQNHKNHRPILMVIIAVFGVGYLIFYQFYIKNNPPVTPNEPDTSAEAIQQPISANTLNHSLEDTTDMNSSQIPTNPAIGDTLTMTANEEMDSVANASDDISKEDTAYNKETSDKEELVMYSEDRILYQDGFFYQSITDDVKERIYGLSYKTDCTIPYEDLRYVSVLYYDFNAEIQTGEIICNKAIANDLVEIFYELYCNEYQIDKIRLVDEYQADDDLSCADNNTSCFNFRTVGGSNTLSKHAQGLAIDINPFQNPYVTYPDGKERISPPGSEPYADRSSGLAHIITENDLCYKLFAEHGFTWGGHWKTLKDYQHFQKAL